MGAREQLSPAAGSVSDYALLSRLLAQDDFRSQFFLHGYGRCVCREAQVTLNEFRVEDDFRSQWLPSAMLADAVSLCSSQGSEERSLVLPLTLTTFAGEEIQLAIDLQEYDRLHEFENAVLKQLPCLGDSSTFGCKLQFVHKDTRKVLADHLEHSE